MFWRCEPTRAMTSSWMEFLDHTQRHTILGRTPLDEWSARHRDLHLKMYNTHKKQTSTPLAGFEPTFPAGERPQAHALRPRGHWDRRILLDEEKGTVFIWVTFSRKPQTYKQKISARTHIPRIASRILILDLFTYFFPRVFFFSRVFNIQWGSSHRSLGCITSERYAVFLRNRYLRVTPIQLLLYGL